MVIETETIWEGKAWACPMCGEFISLGTTKSWKPHGYCKSCGFSFIARQPRSVRIIEMLIESEDEQIVTISI